MSESSEKKRKHTSKCPWVSKKRKKNPKKTNRVPFSEERRTTLAASDKGSWYNQKKLLSENDCCDTPGPSTKSASSRKLEASLNTFQKDEDMTGEFDEFESDDDSLNNQNFISQIQINELLQPYLSKVNLSKRCW